MAGTPFDVGSGEVSLGNMIVIHEAADAEQARSVAKRLENAGIPALVQSETDGLPNIPTPRASHPGAAFVAVPSMLHDESARLLRSAKLGVIERRRPYRAASPRFVASWRARPSLADFSAESFGHSEPVAMPLPDSGPAMPRLFWAALAIAVGAVFQRIVAMTFTDEVAISMLAATSTHSEQLWRLVTAGFTHMGFAHHFGNASIGLLLGVVLFGTHRPGATAATWLASSIVGTAAQMATTGALIAGASAGVYGLVGLWAFGQLERSRVSTLPRTERLKTLGILVLLVPGALTPITSSGAQVAVLAHVAGFAMGFMMGTIFHRRLTEDQFERIDRRSNIGLAVAACVTIAGFTFALPSIIAH